MSTEVAARASFETLRYAQCWEDADVLLEALQVGAQDVCLSVASAGDNALSLLCAGAGRVIAVDVSRAQLFCLELRVAALRELDYDELLRLVGSRPGNDRAQLYRRCRALLTPAARAFWDARSHDIERGIGDSGKFERYFRTFRRRVLPFVHAPRTIEALTEPKSPQERDDFYHEVWDNRRWRCMFAVFFSRFVLGRLGRDPSFFKYVEGSVAERILARSRHALTVLDPAQNPYLQWILYGEHRTSLPHWLRRENVERIRARLDNLEWREQSIETFLASDDARGVSRLNLSDIFEYMSTESYRAVLEAIGTRARPGARLAYWNMLARRRSADVVRGGIRSLPELSERLHLQDKAFFYSAFVVEETS
jgi:S-adenosylmethionine:diacylglycerol 3-amino-3-carboxypropyl transferase